MELPVKKTVNVNVKELRIHLKVRDSFSATLIDDQGDEIYYCENEYVPSFMPGDHYGDYVYLNIDIDSGVILNWSKPSVEDVLTFIDKDKQDNE